MKREITNAKITSVSISMADYNCLTFKIIVEDYIGFGAIGGFKNGTGMLDAKYWEGNGSALVAMMKIMDTVGVEKWEHLKGNYCRVEYDESGHVEKIGHIIKNKWFNVREFFANDDGHAVYVLDERPPKEQDDDEEHDVKSEWDGSINPDDCNR
jgi:hypothetical protein